MRTTMFMGMLLAACLAGMATPAALTRLQADLPKLACEGPQPVVDLRDGTLTARFGDAVTATDLAGDPGAAGIIVSAHVCVAMPQMAFPWTRALATWTVRGDRLETAAGDGGLFVSVAYGPSADPALLAHIDACVAEAAKAVAPRDPDDPRNMPQQWRPAPKVHRCSPGMPCSPETCWPPELIRQPDVETAAP